MSDAATVTALCAGLYASITGASGGRGIGPATGGAGLLANGVDPTTLDAAALRAALVGLTQTLAHPSGTVITLPDQRFVLAWAGQVCLYTTPPPFDHTSWHLHKLCVAAIRAHLAQPSLQLLECGADANAAYLSLASSTVAEYLPFPLLEGIAKKACSAFVAFDGAIIAPFTCVGRKGNPVEYTPGGRNCSNVGHLLQLLFSTVADVDLRSDLAAVFQFISPGLPPEAACAAIFAWRNGSLHGETNTPAGSAVVINLALLIIFSWLANEYDGRQREALASIKDATAMRFASAHAFYPVS